MLNVEISIKEKVCYIIYPGTKKLQYIIILLYSSHKVILQSFINLRSILVLKFNRYINHKFK